jgi:spore maturation protein CgeB
VRIFRSLPTSGPRRDLVWVGNCGDEERATELAEFVFEPMRELRIPGDAYGVRFHARALDALRHSGIEYRGWVANYRVPRVLSEHRFTVHVPRRREARLLPGIPTIRVFEALACGIPLICGPWDDVDGLFGADDYVSAKTGAQMQHAISRLLADHDYARHVAESGRRTVLDRHTVAHRVDELLRICAELGVRQLGPIDSTAAVEQSA